MENRIICKRCGAEYDVSLVRCPFCGTAYAPAEEEEYMDKLEDIREDLQQQPEKGNTNIKKRMGSAVRVIIIAIILVLLLLFGILWVSRASERSDSDRKKEEFLKEQGITTQQEVTAQ